MLHKESAIAVMVAVMLGAASIFGPLSIAQAEAAVLLASETISQDSTESMIIDAVEVDAKKSTSRTHGQLIVKIVQDSSTLSTGTLNVAEVKQRFVPVEVDVENVNVTGSFDILVEYKGTGNVAANGIDVIEGTTVADNPDVEEPEPNNPPAEEPNQPNGDLGNEIASQAFTQDDDESMIVDTVEFSAKKSTSRTSGVMTVALVQNDDILGTDTFSATEIKQRFNDMEASFNSINITGDFEVVFMYEGSGRVSVNSISVPGATEPAEEPGNPTNPPPADGTVSLTVNAVDQAGNALSGMWIEVYSGMSASGDPLFEGDTPETFELDAGQYIVAVADFENNIFQRWQDSAHDRTREATLTTDETFTAVYSTDGSQPPDDPSPPPAGGPGSIVVFAHRIPNENWGPTFTSANAEMWYVLYDSTGWIVESGFYDEEGTVISGLTDGATYYVYATDCDECHGDPHDVVFDHWQDSTTENPRAVMTGDSAHAYYRYDPDP